MTTDERLDALQEGMTELTRIVTDAVQMIEDRFRETRPMIGQIQADIRDIKRDIQLLRERDIRNERKERLILDDRLTELERPKQ